MKIIQFSRYENGEEYVVLEDGNVYRRLSPSAAWRQYLPAPTDEEAIEKIEKGETKVSRVALEETTAPSMGVMDINCLTNQSVIKWRV